MPKTVEVYPIGDTNVYPAGETPDVSHVKQAIQNVDDGGTVVLKRHRQGDNPNNVTAFNFGGDNQDNTIYLMKNVTIIGDSNPTPEWFDPQGWTAGVAEAGGTTIKGGRWPFKVGVDSQQNTKQVSASIKDIRFMDFYRGAIFIRAAKGATAVSGCSFVDYNHSNVLFGDEFDGAWPIIADSTAAPDNLAGQLTITRNFVGAAPPLDSKNGNNLIHVSFCNLKPFTFSNNRITDMHWAGLVVYGNKGETRIVGNNVTKNSTIPLAGAGIVVGVWPAITPADPPDGRPITIDGNTVEVGSQNSNGIEVFLMNGQYYNPHAPNPGQIYIRNNTVHMKGANTVERAALACLGACSKSEWTNNTVEGKAPYGIWVSDNQAFIEITDRPPVLIPSQNRFENNNLGQFTATKAQAFIGETVEHLKLLNNTFGPLANSNPHMPPLDDAVADVRCKGHLGEISQNHFQKSGVQGWETPPAWLGCIYLDTESNNNQVKYHDSDFPAVPLIASEIYNAGKNNHIVRLGP